MKDLTTLMTDLLRASVKGQLPEGMDCTGVDWMKLLNETARHGVPGVVFSVIEDNLQTLNVPFQQKLKWYGNARIIAQQNIKVNQVLYLLVKALNDKGIPSLLLKGQGNAQFYPKPLYRLSGDIDLYIGPDNFAAAKDCWIEAGLVDTWHKDDAKHSKFEYKGITVEPHKYADLLPGKKRNAIWQEAIAQALTTDNGFWVDAEGNTKPYNSTQDDIQSQEGWTFIRTLSLDLNAVQVFEHLFIHFLGGGIHLKQVMDWLTLCKQAHALDQANGDAAPTYSERIRKHLETFGFLYPWQCFAATAVDYLDYPKEQMPCYDERRHRLSQRIMTHLLTDLPDPAGKTPLGHNVIEWLRKARTSYSGYLSSFRLFPCQCTKFLLRHVHSHVMKHVFGLK